MEMIKRKVAVLGSTGSVGTQAIDALSVTDCEYVLLTGGRNIKLLADQARQTKVPLVAVPDEKTAVELRGLLAGESVKVLGGEGAVCEAIRECGADLFVHSIAGMAGIPAALEVSKTGARLAIANKEAIISLGDIIFDNVRKYGGELIPVDSEHSAIFQCLMTSGAVDAKGGSRPEIVKRILLTASGGPFFGKKREELQKVTPEMALAHPTWKMGPKITIDCATLMNKGFEIIEAARLFHVDIDKIEVLVHRQSIIHSMVEYIDTTVMAQLGTPDMRHCVRYALTYPERMTVKEPGLDFPALARLTFDAPDREAFPLLDTAVSAYKMGTTAPAALIAADEEAVSAFIGGKIGFTAISDTVAEAMVKYTPDTVYTAESVFEAEKEAREIAKQIISKY
ncbi:MAG: 1-deoxy-D-xylulose-5-phosphate reductoisomerase [Ruminococcaceae bacterium]|nr:1-deoxy-D-xylulose-5-phosphate reductoisomerase [Oscillospiraceae bacterium]